MTARALFIVVLLTATACADRHDLESPRGAALIADPALVELSGLAASVRQPSVFWAVNDNAVPRRLYRLDAHGNALGRVALSGAVLWDTESLALYRDGEEHWLLLADIGDNHGIRPTVQVHAIAEPVPGQLAAAVEWAIRFEYPDGPRDAEALAVDHATGDLLILTKRDRPARLYRVPLTARHADEVVVAEFIREMPAALFTAGATGFDISPDGRQLVVLSYERLYRWRRAPAEAWLDVLEVAPDTYTLPLLPKAEGVAFSHDGEYILVGSERVPAFVLTVPNPDPEPAPPRW